MPSSTLSEIIVRSDEVNPNVKPASTWPVFNWISQQAGNLITLGVIVMVAFLVWGIILWVGGSSGDNHRRVVTGKVMTFGSVVGAIVIAAAPALIQWATKQNPIS
jgi:hypothetical protein